MSNEFVVIYQKEVEDGLAVVKQDKIPQGDWKGAEEQLKKSLASLQMMEATCRGLPVRDPALSSSAKALRRELNDLMNDVQKNLLLGGTKTGDGEGMDLEAQEAEKKQILRGSGAALNQAKQTLVGIQSNATTIIGELDKQKDTIASAKIKVDQTNDLTVESRNLLRQIESNSTRQKMITYGALLLVAIAVIACFYWVVML
ncbi:hypothetical protein BASA81_004960 [Batrachochytrium salamandrivorans]|nr:hypothetical protein BASA81_004960 [Batrachochytrium salamandrivorans]